MIPYARQEIDDADVEAVVAVLRSDFLTQGPAVPRFERAVADACGAAHGVAVNSATSALHVACLALGLGPGDWLWTSPITFVASANCALYCGARVDFVDIDPRSHCLSVERLAAKLASAERDGRLPKIVVPVHFAGQPADMAGIHALARRYGFRVIEDASHALGARYRGEPVGCGRYSDVAVFSFHPVKIITSGEGGICVTNDGALAERMRRLRSHGITRDANEMTHAPDGPWYYQQLELGYNYRLTDLQAALGASQLTRLPSFLERRRRVARQYDDALRGLPVVTPWTGPDVESALHLYVIRLEPGPGRRSHRQVYEALRADGVGVNLHYIPVYRQPFYARAGYAPDDYPEAERFYGQAISLPMFPGLTAAQQAHVVDAVRRAYPS